MTLRKIIVACVMCVALLAASWAWAGNNIDLSTVPDRDSVQLTIYNSEDLTLVRETRKVTFKPGVNPLQFSWAGTLIDPTSVRMRFVSHADKLDVVDTTFPHDKPQMLYWNVQSEVDGEATIEITYFTSGISWSADYLVVSDPEEKEAGLESYVRVTNNSGEEYENAQVRLVVGTINLVEKIAQLAQVPMNKVAELENATKMQLGKRVLTEAVDRPMAPPGPAGAGGFGGGLAAPKQVIKEGLSEYFIYSIEGTETIPNGWSKRLRSFEGQTVPLKIEYRYRPQQYGDQLVRLYILTNDEKSHLGTTPLPDGVVRVFRNNGKDGLSYLTAQTIKYVPIGDKIELNLGVDPEVVFELIKKRVWRDNLWLQVNGTSTFKRADGDQPAQVEENSTLAGWDDHTLFIQRIRNYTRKAIDVEIRRTFGGHAVLRTNINAKNHDFQTAEFHAAVKPGEKAMLAFELVTKQGHNAKQSNLTVEKAEVKP